MKIEKLEKKQQNFHFRKMFAYSLEAVGRKLVCRNNTEHSFELNMTVGVLVYL